jgi:hypothetical protein
MDQAKSALVLTGWKKKKVVNYLCWDDLIKSGSSVLTGLAEFE